MSTAEFRFESITPFPKIDKGRVASSIPQISDQTVTNALFNGGAEVAVMTLEKLKGGICENYEGKRANENDISERELLLTIFDIEGTLSDDAVGENGPRLKMAYQVEMEFLQRQIDICPEPQRIQKNEGILQRISTKLSSMR